MDNCFVQRDIDLSSLESSFDAWRFSCLGVQADLRNQNLITVFCCQTKSLESMEQDWEGINSEITADYLLNSRSDFEHWNTYLLFVCTEKIPKNTQYEIENNKFSMRKIVAKKQSHFLDIDELSHIASQKILSSSVQLVEIKLNTELKPNLSETTIRLLKSGIGLGQSQSDRDSRELWLSDELERLKTNED